MKWKRLEGLWKLRKTNRLYRFRCLSADGEDTETENTAEFWIEPVDGMPDHEIGHRGFDAVMTPEGSRHALAFGLGVIDEEYTPGDSPRSWNHTVRVRKSGYIITMSSHTRGMLKHLAESIFERWGRI